MPTHCSVCEACRTNPQVLDIINRVKFQECLTLDQVIERVFQASGITLHKISLSRHYRKHVDPALSLQYARQVNAIRSLTNRRLLELSSEEGVELSSLIRFTPVTKKSFDLLSRLKVMFIEISSQFEEFQRNNGGKLTEENSETYAKIAGALSKLASDIARIESSKDIIREIVKVSFINIFRNVINEFVKLVGDKIPQDERELVMEKMKEVIALNVKRLDQDFRRKLI